MYKKAENPKRSWNCIPVVIDGTEYPSLFSACIDAEIGYPNVHNQMKKHGGGPFKVSGHWIVTKRFLTEHPEYKLEEEQEND